MFLKQNRVNQRETGENGIINEKTLMGQQAPWTGRGHMEAHMEAYNTQTTAVMSAQFCNS